MTIGGFDPSGGAGVLADVKTFEQHKLLGMAVNTANTVQTEDTFYAVNWLEETVVFDQLNGLLSSYSFDYTKIGLLQDFDMIIKIKERMPNTRLIWDPVLSASAGMDMKHSLKSVNTVLQHVYFVTPNWNEAKKLAGHADGLDAAAKLSAYCNVYLKGGHRQDRVGMDTVFHEGKTFDLRPKGKELAEKHGSGCVLASALASNLQHGFSIHKACLKTKEYVRRILASNETLLAYHR